MSTLVVQRRHLWLNLDEMRNANNVCFLDASISQGGLFGDTVKDAEEAAPEMRGTALDQEVVHLQNLLFFSFYFCTHIVNKTAVSSISEPYRV